MKRISLILALAVSVVPVPRAASQSRSAPDLVLLNAHIITMNRKRPAEESAAIKDGRISWLGSTAAAKKRFRNAAQIIDLKGATVLPGFIDAHGHLMSLGESFLKLNLKDVATPEEAAARVKERAAAVRPGEWILGWGWDEGKWAAHYPTHQLLTDAAPDNPVFLTGLHSFAAWANKKALDIAGIRTDTPDPENGKIIRDEKTGEPAGVLTNRAQELVAKQIPPLDLEQVKTALELAARECVRNGLTSVHEARVTPIMLQAFRELIKEGRMPLRIYAMLDGANKPWVDEWLERGPEIDPQHRLTIRSVKVFADGALGSRGAALFEPYSDAPNTKGLTTTSEAEIYSLTSRCLARGFQVVTHSIGDAANHQVLDAYEKALKAAPGATSGKRVRSIDPRLRIEHAQVLAPADIPRFAKLGVIASMQPTHCTSDMAWAEKRLGPIRIKGAYAWRSVLKTGAHLPISSDFPGETLNPFYGIYAAVTRQDPEGKPEGGWYPAERLTVMEALRGYTVEAAYAEFETLAKGTIDYGRLADLIVVSEDPIKVGPGELLSARVLKTFIGGKLVYSIDPSN
ncbi:MAG TPA: amidohydrolase family protein [Blastocatellia bacterium]|nr:amidohydrolase family protein [Blastocatellia bacterium]